MARSFNGTSDVCKVTSAAFDPTSSAFSVSAWVSNAASTNALRSYFAFASTSSGTPFFLLGQPSTDLTKVLLNNRDVNNSPRLNYTSTASPFTDSSFHSIIYTQSGGPTTFNVAVYIDGAKETTSWTKNALITVNSAAIGCVFRTSGANFWNGNIAGVALWMRQLSDGEAASLANGLPASHLGPTHYWPLWGVDSPEPDIGNG